MRHPADRPPGRGHPIDPPRRARCQRVRHAGTTRRRIADLPARRPASRPADSPPRRLPPRSTSSIRQAPGHRPGEDARPRRSARNPGPAGTLSLIREGRWGNLGPATTRSQKDSGVDVLPSDQPRAICTKDRAASPWQTI